MKVKQAHSTENEEDEQQYEDDQWYDQGQEGTEGEAYAKQEWAEFYQEAFVTKVDHRLQGGRGDR